MQLVGGQFTNTSAIFGNDVSTFPDFPAEIRAPAGTPAGVSGFQIHFSSHDIKTPGDDLDALVAMNPAALRQNLKSLRKGGILIVNSDSFAKNDLRKANYETSPLDDNSLDEYRLVKIPMTTMTRDAVAETGLGTRAADRCRNFFALGVLYWLYDRSPDPTIDWINEKFAKVADVADANRRALKAGMYYGETAELLQGRYRIRPRPTFSRAPIGKSWEIRRLRTGSSLRRDWRGRIFSMPRIQSPPLATSCMSWPS